MRNGGLYSLMVEHFPGMEEVVGSSPRGGRNFSHGKLSNLTKYINANTSNLYIFPFQIQGLVDLESSYLNESGLKKDQLCEFINQLKLVINRDHIQDLNVDLKLFQIICIFYYYSYFSHN